MGSLGAMQSGAPTAMRRSGGGKLVPEGIEGRVPAKGPLWPIWSINSSVGCARAWAIAAVRTIPELQERAEFLRITWAGLKESHVHDVIITKEAPNYQVE